MTPSEEHGTVNDPSGDEIHNHTTGHDEETLPHFLRTELPRLRRLFHLFGIHALVHHSSNLHITAQGKPAYAVFRLIVLEIRKQSGEPLVTRTEQMELGVEEHIELLHLHAEEFAETIVAKLVKHHKKAEAAQELQSFNRYYL